MTVSVRKKECQGRFPSPHSFFRNFLRPTLLALDGDVGESRIPSLSIVAIRGIVAEHCTILQR